jgi:hypothetical protein
MKREQQTQIIILQVIAISQGQADHGKQKKKITLNVYRQKSWTICPAIWDDGLVHSGCFRLSFCRVTVRHTGKSANGYA